MRFIRMTMLAGMVAGAPVAMAADLSKAALPPAPVIEDDEPENWYLRGDVGYVHHGRPDADFSAASFSGSLSRERVGDSGVAGLGIGYRFSPHVRADVTLDHRFNARFRGWASTPEALMDTGLLQSSALMLNGYVDLGTIGGFTPYIGAGIGVAHNILSHTARRVETAASVNEDTGETIPGSIAWSRMAGDNRYDFAWALMAGVGYQLSSSFTLDLGYRYISLGDVKTRFFGAGAGTQVENIGAHEVRVGVRYALP